MAIAAAGTDASPAQACTMTEDNANTQFTFAEFVQKLKMLTSSECNSVTFKLRSWCLTTRKLQLLILSPLVRVPSSSQRDTPLYVIW